MKKNIVKELLQNIVSLNSKDHTFGQKKGEVQP